MKAIQHAKLLRFWIMAVGALLLTALPLAVRQRSQSPAAQLELKGVSAFHRESPSDQSKVLNGANAINEDVAKEENVAIIRVVSNNVPIAGAVVTVVKKGFVPHMAQTTNFARATTDSDGWARLIFKAALKEHCEIDVTTDYYWPSLTPFKPDQVIELTPMPKARGRVEFADGRAAVGARVYSEGPQGVETRAGTDGRYELPLPSWSPFFAELHGDAAKGPQYPKALEKEIDLTLVKAAPCLGKVIGINEMPIEGVHVEVKNRVITNNVATDVKGIFRTACAPEMPHEIHFQKPGYLSAQVSWRETESAGPIVMVKPSQLFGTARDESGQPLPNVLVAYFDRKTTTAADGSYALNNIDVTNSREVAASFGSREVIAPVARTEGVQHIDFVIPPSGEEVEIQVSNQYGSDSFDWSGIATSMSDAGWNTTFGSSSREVRLPAGAFRFVVTSDSAIEPVQRVVRLNGQSGQVLRFRVHTKKEKKEIEVSYVTPIGRTVRVTVRTPTGEPIGGAVVSAGHGSCLTQENGVCDCAITQHSQASQMQVSARKNNLHARALTSTEQAAVTLVAIPVNQVKVTILGTLAEEAFLSLQFPSYSEDILLKGNAVTIPQMRGERGTACVRHPRAIGSQGCIILEGNESEVAIQVGANGTAQFRFLDEAGQALEGLRLAVDWITTDHFAPNGELMLRLSPGIHMILLTAADHSTQAQALVTIKSDQLTAVPPMQLK
jgi:hypothetical protein